MKKFIATIGTGLLALVGTVARYGDDVGRVIGRNGDDVGRVIGRNGDDLGRVIGRNEDSFKSVSELKVYDAVYKATLYDENKKTTEELMILAQEANENQFKETNVLLTRAVLLKIVHDVLQDTSNSRNTEEKTEGSL